MPPPGRARAAPRGAFALLAAILATGLPLAAPAEPVSPAPGTWSTWGGAGALGAWAGVDPAEAERRADAATEALVRDYWDGGARAFVVARGGDRAEYWIAAEAFDAILDGVERSGGRRWLDVARSFLAGQADRGWSRDFFDDENWMALALIRAADLTGDAGALAQAEGLLEDIASNGWDRAAGGIWWDRRHTQKATASNAGPVISAAWIYERTGDARWLVFAREVFAHWLAEMVDPVSGQVADHLDGSGSKVWWTFTYNEGAMIGAALALHHATGEPAYLETARRIGLSLVAQQTALTQSGSALTDGARCAGDCEQFKGIAARSLSALAEADPLGGWDSLVRSSAAAAWDLARDPASTTFGVNWAGPSGSASLAAQTSAAMALDCAARLDRPRAPAWGA